MKVLHLKELGGCCVEKHKPGKFCPKIALKIGTPPTKNSGHPSLTTISQNSPIGFLAGVTTTTIERKFESRQRNGVQAQSIDLLRQPASKTT